MAPAGRYAVGHSAIPAIAYSQKALGDAQELVRHLQDLHLGYHDTHITGVTISRVFSDVGVINDLLSQD